MSRSIDQRFLKADMSTTRALVEMTAPAVPTDDLSEARHQVTAYCQSIVGLGVAYWSINDAGYTELHTANGEEYLFGQFGVTRLR